MTLCQIVTPKAYISRSKLLNMNPYKSVKSLLGSFDHIYKFLDIMTTSSHGHWDVDSMITFQPILEIINNGFPLPRYLLRYEY